MISIKKESREYFNFSIEKLEKSMKKKGTLMPKKLKNVEELEEWLDR